MKKEALFLGTGVLSSVLGFEITLGWIIKKSWMISIIPGCSFIAFNTGLFFLLIGLVFIVENLGLHKTVSKVLVSILGLGALLTLIEYGLSINLGIDFQNVQQGLPLQQDFIGRPALSIAIYALILSGFFGVKEFLDYQLCLKVAPKVALVLFLISLLSYLGYFLELTQFYPWYGTWSMSGIVALMFMLISVGVWLRWGTFSKLSHEFKQEDRITWVGYCLLFILASSSLIVYSPLFLPEILIHDEFLKTTAKFHFQIALLINSFVLMIAIIFFKIGLHSLLFKTKVAEENTHYYTHKFYYVQEQLRTITDSLPALISYITKEEQYEFVNKTFEDWYKIPKSKIIGKTIQQMIGEANYKQLKPYIDQVLCGQVVTFEQESELSHLPRYTLTTFTPSFKGTKIEGFYVMVSDISSRKLHEEHITHLAHHDNLTGLANRAYFHEKLHQAMARSKRNFQMMALLYMDVDKFKSINDTLGHDVGDALLKQFAERLSKSVRTIDTVCRLGGDEFTVIIESISNEQNGELIVEKILLEIRQPFNLKGNWQNITSSIGMAFYRGEDMTEDELIKRSDTALYKAKRGGRNRCEIAHEDDVLEPH